MIGKKKAVSLFLCVFLFALSMLLVACGGNGGQGGDSDITDPPHVHSYGSWQVKIPATCTEAGIEERFCDGCDISETRPIAALGHDYQNGYCTRCGAVDPNDNTMIDGKVLKNVTLSQSGILSWSRLKVASKYKLTLTLADGEHTYEFDKHTGSVNIKELSDGAKLNYGKNSVKLTAYQYEQITVDGETIGRDVEIYADNFLADSKYSGFTFMRLEFEDELVKLSGFYSEYYQNSQGKTYLLYEKVMTESSEKFNISNLIKNKSGEWKIYKSASDRENLSNEMEYFDFLFDEIGLGDNRYFLRVADGTDSRDYDLVVRGVQYKLLTLRGVSRTINGNGDYIPSYTEYITSADNKKILQYDNFDINALYAMIPSGHIIRDNDFNIYEKDTDYAMPYGNLVLYSALEDEILEQIDEINLYKDIFNLSYNVSSGNSPDTWSLSYVKNSDVKNVIVPSRIIGNKVILSRASFANSDVESVILSSGIESLPSELFAGCNSLSSVTIPSTVTYLGDYLFSYLPETLTIYCENSPANGKWNQVLGKPSTYYTTLKNQDGASSTATSGGYRIRVYEDGTAEVVGVISGGGAVIPDSVKFGFNEYTVTGIASGALTEKTSVIIGANIQNIAQDAFGTNLKEISVTDENAEFFTKDNILYNKDQTQILHIPYGIAGAISLSNQLMELYSEAFKGRVGLTSVTIPDGITYIGDFAFSGCTGLVSVVIGADITTIGNSAFYGCTNLSIMSIPDSVESIGANAFKNCISLTNISIGNGVTVINSYTFDGCIALESVGMGSGTTKIGAYAFNACKKIAGIEIPESVTSIESSAFYGCLGLKRVDIENVSAWCSISFKDASANPLYYAKNLYIHEVLATNLSLPDGLTKIGAYTFINCIELKEIEIPNSVLGIGANAFSLCTGLTKMTLPFVGLSKNSTIPGKDKVMGAIFGSGSFDGAVSQAYDSQTVYSLPPNLSTIIVNGGSISSKAFFNCTQLVNITLNEGITIIGAQAFYNCTKLENMVSYDNVTIIGGEAFYNCIKLKNFSLPENITSIGAQAFYNCSGSFIKKVSGISYAGKWVIGCDTNVASVVLPDDVVGVAGGAFRDCEQMTSIILPEGIKYIGDQAFYRCVGLTSITLPDSIVSIGSGAFAYCVSLQEMTIPFVGASSSEQEAAKNAVFGHIFGDYSGTKIKQYYDIMGSQVTYTIPSSLETVIITGGTLRVGAFSNCSMLKSIITPDNLTAIPSYAFYGCSGLTEFSIPSSVVAVESNAFYWCNGLTSIILPEGLNLIGYRGFMNCRNLTSINIPLSVREIGLEAFYNCTNIIEKEAGVSYIGKWVIGCDDNLTSVELRSDTVGLVNSAFYERSNITSLSIPIGVKSISHSAFYGCSSLTNIVIPQNVVTIRDYAFYGCSSLTSIIIPSSVTKIDYMPFRNCNKLTSIMFEDSEGWYENGYAIILTDPAQNVIMIQSTYRQSSWEKL